MTTLAGSAGTALILLREVDLGHNLSRHGRAAAREVTCSLVFDADGLCRWVRSRSSDRGRHAGGGPIADCLAIRRRDSRDLWGSHSEQDSEGDPDQAGYAEVDTS